MLFCMGSPLYAQEIFSGKRCLRWGRRGVANTPYESYGNSFLFRVLDLIDQVPDVAVQRLAAEVSFRLGFHRP
jgi:hypothetical protein